MPKRLVVDELDCSQCGADQWAPHLCPLQPLVLAFHLQTVLFGYHEGVTTPTPGLLEQLVMGRVNPVPYARHLGLPLHGLTPTGLFRSEGLGIRLLQVAQGPEGRSLRNGRAVGEPPAPTSGMLFAYRRSWGLFLLAGFQPRPV